MTAHSDPSSGNSLTVGGGRAFTFGDDINTDVLAPGLYMRGGIEALAAHCLEAVDPDFAGRVTPGDVVVAGDNFGIGSSREQAAEALKHLGVGAVIARSFGGIFFRNAINLGLAAVACPEADRIRAGDAVSVDIGAGRITNTTTGETLECEALPAPLLAIIQAGGLMSHLSQKLRVSTEESAQ